MCQKPSRRLSRAYDSAITLIDPKNLIMKTTKKIAWAFLFAIFLFACEKENHGINCGPNEAPTEKAVIVSCTPTQSVTGIWAALDAIEAFSNCKGMDCAGETVLTSVLNHYLLADMNTNS